MYLRMPTGKGGGASNNCESLKSFIYFFVLPYLSNVHANDIIPPPQSQLTRPNELKAYVCKSVYLHKYENVWELAPATGHKMKSM